MTKLDLFFSKFFLKRNKVTSIGLAENSLLLSYNLFSISDFVTVLENLLDKISNNKISFLDIFTSLLFIVNSPELLSNSIFPFLKILEDNSLGLLNIAWILATNSSCLNGLVK